MTIQMTVRLADEAAAFVDQTVAEGHFSSRAEYLGWLVRRDAMQRRAATDLAKLAAITGDGDPYPEFADIAASVAADRIDLD